MQQQIYKEHLCYAGIDNVTIYVCARLEKTMFVSHNYFSAHYGP